jgi:hypothetical protein
MPSVTTALLAFLLSSPAPASPAPAPSPSAPDRPVDEAVILFLIDNSASLPPLDPDEKRVVALEKMFTFLQGQRYRLILFAGRKEIYIDDVSRYRNNGQWTDFVGAFEQARGITKGYPSGTRFRIILLTDAVVDPDPADWPDLPPGSDLRAEHNKRLLALASEIKIPLYVILVGDPPTEGAAPGSREQAPGLILDLVRAANGTAASPLAQSLASFFADDGVLLRKFVYRLPPREGLKGVEPLVRRIASPPNTGVERKILLYAVLPLLLSLFVLLGLLVRSFPGPGDVEIVELGQNVPAHLAVDRLRRVGSTGWASTGLSLVGDARDAVASLHYQSPPLELSGNGLDGRDLDAQSQYLLPLGLEDLKRALDAYAEDGSKEEKIYALNLDYVAKNMGAAEAERILTTSVAERGRLAALDFLRAKAHLLADDALRRKLTEPRMTLATYGKQGTRKDLVPGASARIGRYGFLVRDISQGGRKDARIVLYYDRVPSLLGLKTLLPDAFQRLFRFRRSSQRIVS